MIQAVGGEAIVLGHSSGAVLALFAAGRGVPIRSLFLSEPPFRFGADEPAADLPERLQQFVDDGKNDEAVVTFQLEGVGLPRDMVEGIRQSEQFAALLPLAQSTVYDAKVTAQVSTPTPEMLSVSQPVTILRGEQTFPILVTAADRLAQELEGAELVIVPESVMHRPDPAATARGWCERASDRSCRPIRVRWSGVAHLTHPYAGSADRRTIARASVGMTLSKFRSQPVERETARRVTRSDPRRPRRREVGSDRCT